jgi:hypothetical protein
VTAAAAYNINVPSANVIRTDKTVLDDAEASATSTAVRVIVTTTTARGQVDVTATGGVRIITADQLDAGAKVATGTTSLTDFSSANGYEFYAINTSTAAGTLVVSNAGNSKTIYLAGVSTFAYKLELTSTTSAALGGKITVSGKVKDAFGNDLTTSYAEGDFTVTTVGATAGFGTDGTWEYTAATKTYEWFFTAPTTATPVAVQIAFKVASSGSKLPVSVTEFGAPVASQFFTVNAVDLATANAALQAQVAALQVIVDRKVTKKRYNTLARKWNRAFPSQKVALKK